MRVELLYLDGCPGYEALLPRLREIVSAEGSGGDLEVRRVGSSEEAVRERFLGSPTVRIDGEDVEMDARTRIDYGLKCRLYRTAATLSPVPPDEMIREALRAAA
jgi:hypothetical protein